MVNRFSKIATLCLTLVSISASSAMADDVSTLRPATQSTGNNTFGNFMRTFAGSQVQRLQQGNVQQQQGYTAPSGTVSLPGGAANSVATISEPFARTALAKIETLEARVAQLEAKTAALETENNNLKYTLNTVKTSPLNSMTFGQQWNFIAESVSVKKNVDLLKNHGHAFVYTKPAAGNQLQEETSITSLPTSNTKEVNSSLKQSITWDLTDLQKQQQ